MWPRGIHANGNPPLFARPFVANGYRSRVFQSGHRVGESDIVFAEIRFCLGGIPFGLHLVYYCTPLQRVRQRLISLVPHLGARGPLRTYGTLRSPRSRSASNAARAFARLDRGLTNRPVFPCRVLTDTSRHVPLANHYSRSVSPQTSSTNRRLHNHVASLIS